MAKTPVAETEKMAKTAIRKKPKFQAKFSYFNDFINLKKFT